MNDVRHLSTAANFDLFKTLICPVHRTGLREEEPAAERPSSRFRRSLRCANGCEYPVIRGIPFLLPADTDRTHDQMFQESFELAERLGADDSEYPEVDGDGIDRHVQEFVAHTNSLLYQSLVGKLNEYPVPVFPMRPTAASPLLIDLGCGWGRWCFAAAKQGYIPVGIDPYLPHLLSAQRVARQLGLKAYFVVADSRYLPFLPNTFDAAYSFGVLQHLSRENVERSLSSLARVMKPGGESFLHILNSRGLRSMQVQVRQALSGDNHQFATRYWSLPDALKTFATRLGPSHAEVDGFFVQARYEDRAMLTTRNRVILDISRVLKSISRFIPFLKGLADNIFVVSKIRAVAAEAGPVAQPTNRASPATTP